MSEWLTKFYDSLKKRGADTSALQPADLTDEERHVLRQHLKSLAAGAPTIEDYRAKFRIAPTGRWNTATGTFNNIMDFVFEFCPDGSGNYQEYGPFGSAIGPKFAFEWKPCEDYTIWCREVEEEPEADDEPEPWRKIKYAFTKVTHDAGEEIALVEVNEDGTLRKGFRHSWGSGEDPLAYIGPVEDTPEAG